MTAFDSWLTETPEDYEARIAARDARREARRAERAATERDYSPQPVTEEVLTDAGLQTRTVTREPLNYLNFDSGFEP